MPTPTLTWKTPKSLLNPATGYLTGYSHTLNPYTGCAFACSYCYVREMPVAKFRSEPWGTWVDVKQSAAELLVKELTRAKRKGPVTVFMSSSTDPYQPIEYRTELTRSLLTAMAASEAPDFVLVQTRSPLVTRDIDLLQQLGSRVRVSLTVETDLEPVRKAFSPAAPPIPARLQTLRRLVQAGVPVQACVSPVLPSSEQFAERLADTGVTRLCVDDFFMGDGSLGRRTERLGIRRIYESLGLEAWYDRAAYKGVVEQLQRYFPPQSIYVSQAGFLP
ncbi:SPL family radical SAM protein [Paenibacillus cremeus]|uniref:Radical SAM protein n=1 Tax=Paenibacillus cremeus TaxID=2163881 RepID=A0A559KDM7_9BACL|nr:radical SAM protein [Paenibacillus cremeus]TVY10218.1 radical SAM protein [Paenibacillus cremeus]